MKCSTYDVYLSTKAKWTLWSDPTCISNYSLYPVIIIMADGRAEGRAEGAVTY